jgi:YVTN family beta-propeller protein
MMALARGGCFSQCHPMAPINFTRLFSSGSVVLGLALSVAPNVTAASAPGAAGLRSSYLLVANKGDHTLAIVDAGTEAVVGIVAEDGETGHEVAASPDGRLAFVPIYGNSGVGVPGTDGRIIRVIDIRAQRVTGTIDFGRGVRPHCPVFNPRDGLLYVTTELDKAVTIIDPRSLRIVGSVPTGRSQSHMLAISSDGRRGYTANVASGTVSVLDLAARKLITTITVGHPTQRIAVTPDSRWAFTADQSQPRLAVIATPANRLQTFIPLPGIAYGTAATPDSRWLVVALPGINQVGLIDLKTMTVARTLDVPKAPQEVLIRPDGEVAYVSCGASRQVAVIELRTWKVRKLIAAGRSADGLAWAQGK